MAKQWAVITGASSGLGKEFAKVLAARAINLVLVARRTEPMEQLANELRTRTGVDVSVVSLDLSAPGCAATLERELRSREIWPEILINMRRLG